MNPPQKQIWTEALRSGQYRPHTQVQHRIGNLFSPTGVLCDLAAQHRMCIRHADGRYDYCIADPPGSVLHWANLDILDAVRIQDQHLNQQRDFTQIADWIEVNL